EESVPPIEAEEPERAPRIALSPALLARRARLRRAVACVVAFVGALSVAGIGRRIARSTRVHSMEKAVAAVPFRSPETRAQRAKEEPAAQPPSIRTPSPEPAKPEATSAAEDVHPSEQAEASPVDAPLDAAAITALKKDTEKLYSSGKNALAI